MNYLTSLKTFFDNSFGHNKKFIIIPYNKHYYTLLMLLKIKGYIKNFMYLNSCNFCKSYFLVEFKFLNNNIKSFKILTFKHKLKCSTKLFKDILKLCKFEGLFLCSTSIGLVTLEQAKFFKKGGLLILYIY